MKANNLKIKLLPNTPFLTRGKFNLERAMDFSGKVGGICYNEEGLLASFKEDDEATQKRIKNTTSGEHQSVFEHVNIGMYLQNSSKMLNMVLNNEHQYSTSERSLRYTAIKEGECTLSKKEIDLYNKWYQIFYDLIEEQYKDVLKPFKMKTLAKENARYLTSVFVNTEMVHTVPLAQLNREAVYMQDYINKPNKNAFEERLSKEFEKFIKECKRLNLLDERLMSNLKHRKLEIFGEDLRDIPNEFGVTYSTNYKGSLAMYAQAQRHRKGEYQLEFNGDNGFFVPPILEGREDLVKEYLKDINSVKKNYPQGMLVDINERGSFTSFIMKLKERDCSAAQLEIFRQADKTKHDYYESLKEKDHPYVKKLEPYMNGRRCSYPDFNCPRACLFNEGIKGTRRI